MTRWLRWCIAIPALAALCGCGAITSLFVPARMRGAAVADSSLHAVHDALFATFVPLDSLPLDASRRTLARDACDAIWATRSPSPEFCTALAGLERLDVLATQSKELKKFVARSGEQRFDRLAPADRERVIVLLQRSESNRLRILGSRLRLLYLASAYGSSFGAAVADVAPRNGMHPNIEEFLRTHVPEFPPTGLRYDRAARTLAPASGEFDDVVVGSGPAGSVLAHELSAAGRSVVVLDQGALVIPGAMDTRLPSQLTESGGVRFSSSGSVSFRNAEAVGGGTSVNIDLAFPPTHPSVRHQIDSWRREGRIPDDQFTPDDLARAYAWVREKVGTRTPAESEINANNRALWDGARALGLDPKLYDLNSYPPGQWPSPVTDKRSAVALLLEAMRDRAHPLALVPEAHVARVLFERRGSTRVATGVLVVRGPAWNKPGVLRDPCGIAIPAGDTFTVRARRVVLSAGTLGSAALLLASGVPNPNIGRGIVAHIALPVIGEFERPIDAMQGTYASVFVDSRAIPQRFFLEAMAAGPEYAAVMAPGDGRAVFDVVREYRHLAGFGVMLLDTPSPANRVALDANGRPRIDYDVSHGDRDRLRVALAEGIRVMFAAGAKRVLVPSNEDLFGAAGPAPSGLFLTDPRQADEVARRIAFVPNRTLLTSAHLQGSNKMGRTPANSVVAPDHHVWGTERLYVMDASIFPSSIGANPMQSIYTFAKLLADRWTQPDSLRAP